ncbi:MAG: DMT family transporter [Planctomycetes bacterium]|nr:DMT family transporter [Planctomycetota bacterium]
MPSALRVHGALITVSLLFGGNYVFTKRILAHVTPGSWVLFRLLAATAVLLPLALWLRRRGGLPRGRVLLGLVVAALLGVAANQVLFVEGLARTTPEHSAVVNALIPTWTLLIAVAVGQERLSLVRVLAVLCSLLGVSYLLGADRVLFGSDDGSGSGAGSGGGSTLLGDLLSMSNGFVFALHLVLLRRIGRDVDPWTSTAILFVVGTSMLALWSGSGVTAADVAAVTTPPVLWFALYVVLAATVLTYALNTWALRHTQSSQVALYINVQPLVAAVLNAAMGAPWPDHRFLVAVVMVGVGLWLQARAGR